MSSIVSITPAVPRGGQREQLNQQQYRPLAAAWTACLCNCW